MYALVIFIVPFALLQPEALEAILNCCLYGGKMVVTDILEADLKGVLPVGNPQLSKSQYGHDDTVIEEPGGEAEEGIDGPRSQEAHLEAMPLLSYLAKRPMLVSLYNYVGKNYIAYLCYNLLSISSGVSVMALGQRPEVWC